MKFLTRLGQILLKGVEIVSGFGPIIGTVYPQSAGPITIIQHDLEAIAAVIAQVEAFGQVLGLPGPQKLLAAVPMVAQVILKSTILVGRKIADPALFQVGVKKVADGFADILNSLKDDIDTESKT